MKLLLSGNKITAILLAIVTFLLVSCQHFLTPKISVFHNNKIAERITFGERSIALDTEQTSPAREQAIRSIRDRNYDTALRYLTDYFSGKPNDPEALIFFNNIKAEQTAQSYTIAVSLPISSDLNGSLEILRGVAHAQHDWNLARDNSGQSLKVAIADDDDNNPNNGTGIAEAIATELSNRNDILAIIGHYSSDTSLATANIYQDRQLVAISPVSTSVQLTDYSPYFFRTVPSDAKAAQSLAQYGQLQLSQAKVAVFYNSDSNYSQSLRQEFMNALGKEMKSILPKPSAIKTP
ncbi:ABC transporter substrate-binding protein [Roseofilum casamattae]|uniref:ABC transporter substrate-binding protein n=1 Tax=Roseofilum casamattae BLCC-M143 TaxID=3022442 RepID=A0ABT7BSB2_9CYAN|nr:ABC transporter substrate-binding protein [Roseofilum casamattae]MDJ1182065.1 ABC transporter substrate-binding protein [Roseofilum casamattae BLCC-M143]